MAITNTYQTRPVRFLELYRHGGWHIKVYSISVRAERVDPQTLVYAKLHLQDWLQNSTNYPLETYHIATLILHEGKEGCFAILNWWIDENMLQNHVFLSTYDHPAVFQNYSDKGMATCVWEMAVWWFERNAWVEHVLQKAPHPDLAAYLAAHLEGDF